MDLNIEIEEYSRRIEMRQSEIEVELNILANRIITYTNWAWIFVWLGIALSIFSIGYYCYVDIEEEFGLNLLGDFMAGAVASIWSLAGLFLIYRSEATIIKSTIGNHVQSIGSEIYTFRISRAKRGND